MKRIIPEYRTPLDVRKPIADSSTQNPYREMTYNIAAGARVDVFEVFDFFRVISITGAGQLSAIFGENSVQTIIRGAGLGMQFYNVFDRITLINSGASAINVTVAFALGVVIDNRLNFSGTVSNDPLSGKLLCNTYTLNAATSTQVTTKYRHVWLKMIGADCVLSHDPAMPPASWYPLISGILGRDEVQFHDVGGTPIYALALAGTPSIYVTEVDY
ncbi:MAG: hypothetical protein SFU99_03905 [Saprospiraceae bacterium]|nr:hypothetical protein [Saprospiraceae bacterium]